MVELYQIDLRPATNESANPSAKESREPGHPTFCRCLVRPEQTLGSNIYGSSALSLRIVCSTWGVQEPEHKMLTIRGSCKAPTTSLSAFTMTMRLQTTITVRSLIVFRLGDGSNLSGYNHNCLSLFSALGAATESAPNPPFWPMTPR